MHDAEGVFYFSAHADKKAVLDFCIMHGKENRKMCFPGIASDICHTFFLKTFLLRPVKSVFDNVLLEHDGLHSVLPYAVHPDLGHPPDTQEYLGLLSEPFNTTQTY